MDELRSKRRDWPARWVTKVADCLRAGASYVGCPRSRMACEFAMNFLMERILKPWHPTLLGVTTILFLLSLSRFYSNGSGETPAVEAIEELHGRITRDEELPGKPVIAVDLSDHRDLRLAHWVKDPALKHLREFKHLRRLNLSGALITDDGLKNIGQLSALQDLHLCCTQISDARLGELTKLKELRFLCLLGTSVTDAGIERLKRDRPSLKVWR